MRKAASKRINLYLSIILLLILHFPLLSAHHKPVINVKPASVQIEASLLKDTVASGEAEDLLTTVNSLYENMQLDLAGLSKETFDYAMKGFNYLLQAGKLENGNIISIADFSLPSSKKRLFVIDLQKGKLLFNTYVAHGVNSGAAMANTFSNQPESNKSSLGFYETLNTYIGGHGYSLRLQGLEKGINDNANSRDIVIHAADYVDEAFIKARGFLGRSWGCPALPEKLNTPIINKIKDGTCLFIYSPDKTYLNRSKIINA
jgi:L,D-transpeptidase catalytic domain